MVKNKINQATTIKVSKEIKNRLDGLKEHRRESYEEIITKMLEILNTCKVNPPKARALLSKIDNRHKEITRKESESDITPEQD